jgi:hypothetical protein
LFKPQNFKKMKTFTLIIALLLINIANFAQTITCPSYFRRNNGNGACPDGQLKLYFTNCPPVAPVIDSVYTNGVKANVNFALPDASKCNSLGFIGYCVSGGNMPPASTWTIYFHSTNAVNQSGCIVPEGGVLPIGIKTFFAKRNNSTVTLTWQTAFESNAQGFEIQKKSDNGFITIGTIAATNNESGSSYSFIDNNNMKVVSEYRLKLLSRDADAVYSEIRSVKGLGAGIDFTVYPNPAVRNAKISISNMSEASDVQVIDNTGRVVKLFSIKSNNAIEINNLQIGIYRIRLVNRSSGESITKSLTVIQ